MDEAILRRIAMDVGGGGSEGGRKDHGRHQ